MDEPDNAQPKTGGGYGPCILPPEIISQYEQHQALAAINEQITMLAPVLNTRPIANGVTVASSNANSPVDTLLKRHAGSTYLLAAGARPGIGGLLPAPQPQFDRRGIAGRV